MNRPIKDGQNDLCFNMIGGKFVAQGFPAENLDTRGTWSNNFGSASNWDKKIKSLGS